MSGPDGAPVAGVDSTGVDSTGGRDSGGSGATWGHQLAPGAARRRGGPLAGLRVLELAGIGPAPFAGMVLADLGADVLRVDRPGGSGPLGHRRSAGPGRAAPGEGTGAATSGDLLGRGKRSIAVDLRAPEGRDLVLALAERHDVLLEGFRPGVVERLGVGPDACLSRNPSLVYGRMTGWGQDGPLARTAGHDIDYVALTGALWAVGAPEHPPEPPLNLLGDFGGGAMLLVVGVLAALHAVRAGGPGQVVDAAMVDGTALLTTLIWSLRAQGAWHDARGANALDGGAPFYDVYECADGKYLAVGAIEPQFYAELVKRSGFEPDDDQYDEARWPSLKARWTAHFRTRTRDEWVAMLEGSDACAAPVLEWVEAPEHPHLAERRTFVDVAGVRQPAPAPRFTVTPAPPLGTPPARGADTDDVLASLGVTPDEIAKLRDAGVVA